ncbi:MAG: DsrE family protein [Sphingobacteriales bacterium]|nr:DsrE family protein [Sphingobacteriales bacterium]MBI3720202.1 DsrE family protein [Sphingobacteriales bacterium]
MKKISLLLLTAFLLLCTTTKSQQPYNVVFDITTKDTAMHQTVLRWIKLITDAHKDAKLEVVFYGQSLDMVTQNKSVVADEVMKYAKSGQVEFKVCEIAMKHWNIDKSQLLPGVITVPDGIYEIISKQGQGWGYIKVVR